MRKRRLTERKVAGEYRRSRDLDVSRLVRRARLRRRLAELEKELDEVRPRSRRRKADLAEVQRYKTLSTEEELRATKNTKPTWADDTTVGKGVDEYGAKLRLSRRLRRLRREVARLNREIREISAALNEDEEERPRERRSARERRRASLLAALLSDEGEQEGGQRSRPFAAASDGDDEGEEFAPSPDMIEPPEEEAAESEDVAKAEKLLEELAEEPPAVVSPTARASVIAAFLSKAFEVDDDNFGKLASLGADLAVSLEDHVVLRMAELLNPEGDKQAEGDEPAMVPPDEEEKPAEEEKPEEEAEGEEIDLAELDGEDVILLEEAEPEEGEAEEEAPEGEEVEVAPEEEEEEEEEEEVPEVAAADAEFAGKINDDDEVILEASEGLDEEIPRDIDFDSLTASEIEEVDRILESGNLEQVLANDFEVEVPEEDVTASEGNKAKLTQTLPQRIVEKAQEKKLQVDAVDLSLLWK